MLCEFVWNRETLTIVMIFSIPLVTILGGFWLKIEKTRSENDLKRRMVERGMSVEEMERVMAARPSKD